MSLGLSKPESVGHARCQQSKALDWAWSVGTLAILFMALALRVYGIHWDAGYLLHPDERFQLMVAVDRIRAPDLDHLQVLVDPARSPWNPRSVGPDGQPQSFAYGTLPLYVLEMASWLVDRAQRLSGMTPATVYAPYQALAFRGRLLTAVLDVVTILFVMMLARQLAGRLAGLLSGLLLAASIVAIQQAHFFVVDPWATAFGTGALWGAAQLAQRPSRWPALRTGIACGLALACKVSMWPLLIPVAVAIIFAGVRHQPAAPLRSAWLATPWCWVVLGSLLAYALFEPYTVLQPAATLHDLLREWQIARGEFDVPYTRQYVDTIPFVYQFVQLARWGIGPTFFLASIIAVLCELIGIFRLLGKSNLRGFRFLLVQNETVSIRVIVLVWVIVYALTTWTAETKYLRYSLPLIPPLAIITAIHLSDWVRSSVHAWRRWLAVSMVLIVLSGTWAWALAFLSVYREPHTRVQASAWILAHVPVGARIGVEHWDDRLPLPLPGYDVENRYHFVTFTWYDDRSPEEAFQAVVEGLSQVDYIILSSDRLAGSIPRLPWRYPVISEYYRLLDTGALGFQLVHEKVVESELGPVRLFDLAADESFTVYDHPRVRVYQKVEALDVGQLRERFAWALNQPWYPQRDRPEAYKQLLGIPSEAVEIARDVGWSERWTNKDFGAIAIWCGLLYLLLGVGLPLVIRVAGHLPDAGFGLARPLGLAIFGYPVWLAASWRVLPFEMPWIIVLLLLILLPTWWMAYTAVRGSGRGHTLNCPLHQRKWWLYGAASELVFWAVFSFFLFLRWLYPDLWHPYFGGEKPMELAYTNAIARSRWMPPYDPWFADGVQNYYYYGFFLVALLWKVTGLLPERGFQLALATFAGMVATVAMTCGLALVKRICRNRDDTSPARWILAGGLGAVWLVLFAGNLDPLIQLVQRRGLSIDFWQSSRAIEFAITEFPYFSFLYADLHPHMLALPFWLSVVALGLAFLVSSGETLATRLLRWFAAVILGATAAVTNSWDLPLVIVLLALVSLVAYSPRRIREGVVAICLVLAAIWLSRFLFSPFFNRFVSPVTAVALTRHGSPPEQLFLHLGLFFLLPSISVFLLLVANGMRFGPRNVYRSRQPRTLWLSGVAAGSIASLGFLGGHLLGRQLPWLTPPAESVSWLPVLFLAVTVTVTLAFGLLILSNTSERLVMPVLVVSFAGGLLAAWRLNAGVLVILISLVLFLLATNRSSSFALPVVLWTLGLGIVYVTELFFIVDDLYGAPWERMNTVFKLLFEAWPLLALGSWGIALGTLYRLKSHLGRDGLQRLGILGLVTLFGIGLLYPLLGTPERLALRLPSTPNGSLDGYGWMINGQFPNSLGEPVLTSEDRLVIDWLRQNVKDNAVILEASIGPYRGNGSRFSSATGLPTVLGWDRHERQQRTRVLLDPVGGRLESPLGDAVDRRLLAVREIYQTTNLERKRALLAQYNVRYVIVGSVEQRWRIQPGFAGASQPDELYAAPGGLAAFHALEGTRLRVVATFGSTVIYEVLPTR